MNKSISYITDQINSFKTKEKDEGLQCLEILIHDLSSRDKSIHDNSNYTKLFNGSDKQYCSLFNSLIELVVIESRGPRQTPTRRLVKTTSLLYASIESLSEYIREDTARFVFTSLTDIIVGTFKEHDYNTEGFSMVVKSLLAICKTQYHLRHLRVVQINGKIVILSKFIQNILQLIRSSSSEVHNSMITVSTSFGESQYTSSNWPVSPGILSMICECLYLLYKETVQIEPSSIEYIWGTVQLYFKSVDEVLEAHLHMVRLSTEIIRTNLLENAKLCNEVVMKTCSIFGSLWQKRSSPLRMALLCFLKASRPVLKAALNNVDLFGSVSNLSSSSASSNNKLHVKDKLRDIYTLVLRSYTDIHHKNRFNLEDIKFFPQNNDIFSINMDFDDILFESTDQNFWNLKDKSKFEYWFLLTSLNALGLICEPVTSQSQRTQTSPPSPSSSSSLFEGYNSNYYAPQPKRRMSVSSSFENEPYMSYLIQSLRQNLHDNSKSLTYIQLICFYFRSDRGKTPENTSNIITVLDFLVNIMKSGNDGITSWAILCIGTFITSNRHLNMDPILMSNIIRSAWVIAFKKLQDREFEESVCYFLVSVWENEAKGNHKWATISNDFQPTLGSIFTSADINGPQSMSIASFEFWKLLYTKVQATGSKNNLSLLEEKLFLWLQRRWNLSNSSISTEENYYVFDEIRSGLPEFLIWLCGFDLDQFQLSNNRHTFVYGNMNSVYKCEPNTFVYLRNSTNYLYRDEKLASASNIESKIQIKSLNYGRVVSPIITINVLNLINININVMDLTISKSDGNISAPQMLLYVHSLAISLTVLIALSKEYVHHNKAEQDGELHRTLPQVVGASISLVEKVKTVLSTKRRLVNDSYLYHIAFYTKMMRDISPIHQTGYCDIFGLWVGLTQIFSDQMAKLINLRLVSHSDLPQSFYPEDTYIYSEKTENITILDSSNLFLLSYLSKRPSLDNSHWAKNLTQYLKSIDPKLLMKERYTWLDIFGRNICQDNSGSSSLVVSIDPIVLEEIGNLMVYVGTDILRSYVWEYTDLVFRFVSDLVTFFSSSTLVTYNEQSTLNLALGSFYGWILNIAVDSRTSLFSRLYCLSSVKEINLLVENKRYFQILVDVLGDLLDGSPNLVSYTARGVICDISAKYKSFASLFNDDFFSFLDQINSDSPEKRVFNRVTRLTLSYALSNHFQEALLSLLLDTRDKEMKYYVEQCIGLLDGVLLSNKRMFLLENTFVEAYASWVGFGYSYSTFPAVIYGFLNIEEFLEHYLPEIISLDIVIKGPREGMQTVNEVSNLLDISDEYVLSQSLAKTIAYYVGKCESDSFSFWNVMESMSKDLKLSSGSPVIDILKSRVYDIYREVLLLSIIPYDSNNCKMHDTIEKDVYLQGIYDYFATKDYPKTAGTFRISVGSIPSILNELEAFSGLTDIKSAATFCAAIRATLGKVEGCFFEKDKIIHLQRFELILLLNSDIALTGYPYELALSSTLPFLFDPICKNVAKDIFHFLVTQGKPYLSSRENIKFLAESSFLVLESYFKSNSYQQPSDIVVGSSFHKSLLAFYDIFALINSKSVKFIRFGFRYILNQPDQKFDIDNFYSLRDFWQSYSMLYRGSIKLVYYELLLVGLKTDQESFDWSAVNCLDPAFVSVMAEILKTPEIKFSSEFTQWVSKLLVNYYASGRSTLDIPRENRTLAEKLSSMNRRPLEERPVVGILYLLKYKIKSSSLKEMICADNIIGKFYGFMVQKNEVLLKVSQRLMTHDSLHHFMVHRVPVESEFFYEKPVGILESTKCEMPMDDTYFDVWLTHICSVLCSEIKAYYSYFDIGHLLNGLEESTISDIFSLLVLQYMITVRTFQFKDKLTSHLSALLLQTKSSKIKIVIIRAYLFCRNFGQVADSLALSVPNIKLQLLSNECRKLGMHQEALFFYELGEADSPISQNFESLSRVYEALSYYDIDLIYGIPSEPSLENMISNLTRDRDYFKVFQYKAAEYDCKISLGEPGSLLGDAISNSLSINGMEGISSTMSRFNSVNNSYGNSWRLDKWDLPEPALPKTPDQLIYKLFKQIDSHNVNFVELKNIVFSKFGNPGNRSQMQVSEKLRETMKFLMIINEVEEICDLNENEEMVGICKIQKNRLDTIQENETFENVNTILNVRKIAWSMAIKQKFEGSSVRAEWILALTRSIENLSAVSRTSNNLQYSRKAIMELKMLSESNKKFDFVREIFVFETACLLYEDSQTRSAIQMLRSLTDELCRKNETKPSYVSLPLALGLLGKWNSEGRYESVAKVLDDNFNLAMKAFRDNREHQNLSKVLYLFGEFCDKQLQDPAYQEKLDRTTKFRDTKKKEIKDLETRLLVAKEEDKHEIIKKLHKTKLLCESDEREIWKLKDKLQYSLERAVSYYLRCINDCDDYDHTVSRICSIWLGNSGCESVNEKILKNSSQVVISKLVPWVNQISSRILDEVSVFQRTLRQIIIRMSLLHSYHCLYQLIAMYNSKMMEDGTNSSNDSFANSRSQAARNILEKIKADGGLVNLESIMEFVRQIISLTSIPAERGVRRISFDRIKDRKDRNWWTKELLQLKIPPPTMHIKVRKDHDYSLVPYITAVDRNITLASGLSRPKILTFICSNGKEYKMLAKGKDDARQDAVMEQVFEYVDAFFKRNSETRKRDLSIRTYKIVPLAPLSGVIEFVNNSFALNEYLIPSHEKYFPDDMKMMDARKRIAESQKGSTKEKIATFRQVTANIHPVLKYFFFENFTSAEGWLIKRTSYTRSTAAISMLGYILGIGDRHCGNVMLDKNTGEVIHIDFGISFEDGKRLPVPELVPFRLTRDIVDGMGVNGIEGTFRRCCIFTLDLLRSEMNNIKTILDVLRHDPLYSWTMTSTTRRKIQETTSDNFEYPEHSSDGSDAHRALSTIYEKLSNSLKAEVVVNQQIQEALDVGNLAVIYCGWSAFF